jgi:hypothetical protein
MAQCIMTDFTILFLSTSVISWYSMYTWLKVKLQLIQKLPILQKYKTYQASGLSVIYLQASAVTSRVEIVSHQDTDFT